MVRRSSQSQTTSTTGDADRSVTADPCGTPTASAGMRRRRLTSCSGGGSGYWFGSGGGGGSNMLRFYTDEVPGLKISPTVVRVMSLCIIGFVTALHVFGFVTSGDSLLRRQLLHTSYSSSRSP